MKWYGKGSSPLFKKFDKKNKIFIHKTVRNSAEQARVFFHVPVLWEFVMINKKTETWLTNVFLFSAEYFWVVPFQNRFAEVKYYRSAKTLSFYYNFRNSFYSRFWNKIFQVFYSFSKLFFKKLKFKGKGYYIYKNIRNTVTLQMGYSHIIRLYAFKVRVKFTAKTVILMFGTNRKDLLRAAHGLKALKPINIFTGRGIRFARQIVYKKTGKMSAYR